MIDYSIREKIGGTMEELKGSIMKEASLESSDAEGSGLVQGI